MYVVCEGVRGCDFWVRMGLICFFGLGKNYFLDQLCWIELFFFYVLGRGSYGIDIGFVLLLWFNGFEFLVFGVGSIVRKFVKMSVFYDGVSLLRCRFFWNLKIWFKG